MNFCIKPEGKYIWQKSEKMQHPNIWYTVNDEACYIAIYS